ncbi:PSD1 and planctomycete cytochrome C domain-containing protein [Tundrisphaera sp. TA3]|uniref:PSD1 and planctomycete cytochrome C domain-containing protein n=1 Tax=Tundrisphaera sp. TA3 TaxID=3435775 RepID=UPI003EBB9D9D
MMILFVLLVGMAPRPDDGPGRAIDYMAEVKPMLARQCVSCHGAEKPRGGLRLDTAAAAIKGGRGGPSVIPGNAEDSPLYTAVISEDDGERMPLKRPPLTADEAAILRAWIDSGAKSPADEAPTPPPPPHWAFIAPARPAVPEVADPSWPRNPIDRFIAARLDRDGIRPSPEADRVTLARRLSLDLIGLPPTPEEVDAFVRDETPEAYERLVDRLLASPHYGERWGRQWLDMARYADSNGYSIDAPRQIWPYRDWVIDAFNRDFPFDQFVVDQIAGDLRPDASIGQRIATGFHRNTQINQEGGIDPEQFRVESIIDRVNTTGTVFLGLTVGCAQCHDHKYDPISQKDYYSLYAFFNDDDEPDLPVATPEEVARRDEFLKKADAYLDEARRNKPELSEAQKAWEASLDMAGRQKQSQEVRAAFDIPFEQRDDAQQRVVFAAFVDQAPAAKSQKQAVAKIKKAAPPIVSTMVLRRRSEPRDTRLLVGGDFTRLGDPVGPGTPKVLPALKASAPRPGRMDLANWLVDPANPLTARVAVNRMWQEHFGRGLVETENDFGTQGSPPSHPALLDWLATEFVASGWSQKAIHRLIVTSAAYRQSSRARPDLAVLDPINLLLARQSRLRVDAELVRDAALTASGLLSRKVGGPSVFPPQPDGVMTLGQMRREWKPDDGPDRYRRGLYTYFWRATPHPLLMVFDAPDATRSCTRRPRSNTPLQALTLLNDPAFIEFARALADRVIREAPADDAARIDRAFRLCLARDPSESEAGRLAALLDQGKADSPERDAWTAVARVLLNLDEFITRE